MQFLILGPIEVRADGERVALGSGHQETVLAMLLTDPNRVVPLHRLVEAAWDGDSPATARRQIQNTVSALRARLARAGSPDTIVEAEALIGLGACSLDLGSGRDAEDSVRLALDIAEQTGYRRLREHAREVLARIASRGAACSGRDTG
jgi:DNA-binding SARP family transcriptional activator